MSMITQDNLEGATRAGDGRDIGRAPQRDRPRARLHPHALGPGVHQGARRNHADAPRLTARGIAEVITFLASPRASHITGTTVAADGGRRAI